MDIFSGDPKLYLDEDGSDITFHDGNNQPIMEIGKANTALIALFTGEGWCGNVFVRRQTDKFGSSFGVALHNPVTLKSLAIIRDAAEKALLNAGFVVLGVTVSNTQSHRIDVSAKIKNAIGQEHTLILVYGRGPEVVSESTWQGISVTWQGESVSW